MPIRKERRKARRVADLAHQRFDLLARVLAHQGRVVDDPRNGLLRYPGQTRDVVDRGGLAFGQSVRRRIGFAAQ